jgi:hypothetical protein
VLSILYEKKTTIIIVILFQLYFYGNMEFLYALTNQTKGQTDKNSLTTIISSNVIPSAAAIIAPVATILLTFYNIKKRQQEQTIAHNNSLEYDYSIDLRRRRSEAYVGLWELTQIKYSKYSWVCELENQETSLSEWYFDKGHGMLLTEHSQKLFYNFKETIEDLSKNWYKIPIEERDGKIKNIKDIASALRTSLLKDIGTRASLRNLPSYDELAIQEPKEKDGIYIKYLEINYAFFGNLDLNLKNKNILFLITNLDKNEPIDALKEQGMTLEIGKWYSFKWYYKKPFKEELKPGKYSIRITISDIITSERDFKLPP